MKRLLLAMTFLSFPNLTWTQPLPDYYSRTRFLMAPPAAFENGLVGFANPANLMFLHKPEARFFWATEGSDAVSLEEWGLFTGFKYGGFSIQRQKSNGVGVTDFRLSLAYGQPAFSFGLAYGWSAGRFDALGREKLLSLGTIVRPSRFLSFGLVGNFSLESQNREGTGEIGVRPFGNPRLTLFADAAIQRGVDFEDGKWSTGAALQIFPGVHLASRYFNSDAFTLGLAVNFGTTGVGAQGHFDSNTDHAFNTHVVRVGGLKPSFRSTHLGRDNYYVPMSLKGRMDYLKYRLFDSGNRLKEVLNNIEAARNDPRVSVIALNLSSMQIRPEHAWEIREALKGVQAATKKIIIFIDRARMTSYHLASVADKIVLDPQGSILLQGYVLDRTYLKGTLEKLGLGFDEWRFFKYKSANETFSRDSMSEADHKQLQAYVDDWYELTRAEVCSSRFLSQQTFDQLIDEETYFMPEEALESGLVDTLARWSEIDGIVKSTTGTSKKALSANSLLASALPQQNWGELPKVAVVYGLGVCALDEGIKARWLEGVFLALKENKSVKAVVFRVDSPGGDGMASDLVAEALKKCSESKPVIISQGQVAGSGGYWISMYGDQIVAGPNTVTGSIGVIGGWVYDKGLSEKIGMTSDLVRRGKHADLGHGVSIPYLNLEIPARNLTPEERAEVEEIMKKSYHIFVKKVAEGRGLSEEKVREIAEGRVYSGIDGQENGLVDEIGGLLTAIALAKEKSGLEPTDEVQIVEIPEHEGLFDLREQFSPVALKTSEAPVMQFLKILSEHPGEPMFMMLPGTYPSADR